MSDSGDLAEKHLETYIYLNTFAIGDLIFPNMLIIACADLTEVSFQMILSTTLFNNVINNALDFRLG